MIIGLLSWQVEQKKRLFHNWNFEQGKEITAGCWNSPCYLITTLERIFGLYTLPSQFSSLVEVKHTMSNVLIKNHCLFVFLNKKLESMIINGLSQFYFIL
jgi:hypothetical protein